jgi:cephalosporin-C deacetylase-like acetyl esterase
MRFAVAALLVSLSVPLAAQDDDAPWRRMLDSKKQVNAYLERAARELTDKASAEISGTAAWEKVKEQRLEEMRDMLGLLPWPERTPLNVQVTGTLDKGGYTIEKIAFESMPKVYVTANLYIPKSRSGKAPGVIYVCGHAYSPYGDKTEYQRHGISFAKNGYVAMILDSIQIAETFGMHHGINTQEMFDWYARGYTPAGVEVWNAMRAIDYLETRPEVDKDRIGMTGRSGGAAMSWFTAAVDPRVKVVAPVMGISTYAANVRENTQRLHCDCMFPVNGHRHDMIHQGALIAPRPLLMAHGAKDALFPVAGYEEFKAKVGGLYASYGKPADFDNVVVDTDHKDSDFLREKVIRWFDRYLMQAPERKLDMDYSNAAPETLAVFRGKPPSDALNYRIHETFTTRPAPPAVLDRAAWTGRSGELLATLRAKVFHALPQTAPPLHPLGHAGAGFEAQSLRNADGIDIRVLTKRTGKSNGKVPALLYVASDGDDPVAVNDLLAGVNRRAESAVMVVYPRGIGEVPWDKTFWKATLRNAMHVGETVDSMRLKDVISAFLALREMEGVDAARVMVLGKGISGALGLYAAILEPRIHQVMLMDPPVSHRQGPIFLNVLRYTDLPEAAALLAPRRLNFYGHLPPEFDYTRRVFAVTGNADRVFLAMSIEGVLQGRYDHDFASGL